MSLSQIAEFGFPKLAKAFEWTWQERKDPKSGNLGQAGPHFFARIFYVSFDTTIMYLGL